MNRTLIALALLLATSSAPAADSGPKGGPEELQELKYRPVGPALGGRVSRAVGVPSNPLVYYAAVASGGVWKTVDGGLNWKPIFDEQPTASIGSIAVAASDPNIVYVGSGEGNIRGNVVVGDGIYKSTDAGKTWKHVWKQSGQIGTLVVHPTNPDIAFAAVLGRPFGPNPERGVYRTTDGGTWKQVLFKDADTGACDICFDPANPRILFAGLWQARRKPWEFVSGGPGGGLYISRDSGDTWTRLTEKGLPEGVWGRIGLGVAPSDSRRVYALIEAEKGGLFRSDDGGDNWKLVNPGRYLRQRAWYFSTLTVDPTNPDVVYCPTVRLLKSIDGGKSFGLVKGTHHGDHHDVWIDPKNPKRIIESNDGGVDLTTNGGETWYAPPLPIAQFYHVAVDNRVPFHLAGPMQDIGCAAGPSNNLASGGIPASDWYGVGGGETGFAAFDPTDPNVVYAGEYGGTITRFDARHRQARNVSIYPTDPSGHAAEELRYRFNWTAPLLVSPHDPKTLYHAANVLFRTTDGGLKWTAISPDLTRDDKTKQKFSGGPITGDNVGTEYYCTIFALAESPRVKGLLWVGTDDGLVQVSRDAGKTWTNVAKNIPGLPEWATISCVEPSRFVDGGAFVVADAHRLDNHKPYVWETTDFGQTWKPLAAGLPTAHLNVVREDPTQKGLLYVGSERGVHFSTDGGANWKALKLNLPTVPVTDLVVKDDSLVVCTSGRSLWIFDDLTPVRKLTAEVVASPAHLFPPRPTYRWRYYGQVGASDRGAGDNPPKGALVYYYLKAKPKDPITLEVLDARGERVQLLSSKEEEDDTPEDDPDGPEEPSKKTVLTVEPGVNQAAWDLRAAPADYLKKVKIDTGEPPDGPLAPPGTYTLRLTVAGKTFTSPLEVKADPRVTIPAGDLAEHYRDALKVRDVISKATELVTRLRTVRSQLTHRNDVLKDDPKTDAWRKSSQELVDKLNALEEKIHNPKAEVTYDILAQKGGARLYSKLINLYDVMHSSDGPMTQGMTEVLAEETQDLQKYATEFQKLVAEDLAKLNEQAKKLEVPGVLAPAEKSAK